MVTFMSIGICVDVGVDVDVVSDFGSLNNYI